MARLNKTGVRGLICEAVRDPKDPTKTTDRYSIDLRYRDAEGLVQRYRERLPDGVSAAAAKKRAQLVNNSAAAGTLIMLKPRTLGESLDEYEKWAAANRP